MVKKDRDLPFGRNLARLRRARGWTQDELAARAKIAAPLLRRYETGKVNPSIVALSRLARALTVNTDALVFDEGHGIAEGRIADAELLRYFEQVDGLPAAERQLVKVMLEAVIVRNKLATLMEKPVQPPSDLPTRAMDVAVDRIAKAIAKQDARAGARSPRH